MTIYLTRHGETEYNRRGMIQGKRDIPLDEKGKEEAKELALKVKSLPLDMIITSPLIRARETAEIVNRERNLPLFVEPRIHELDYGDFEGKPLRNELGYKPGAFFFRYPNGEGYKDAIYRVYSFLHELESKAKDKNILMVAHTGISRIIVSYFKDMTNEEFLNHRLANCEIEVLKK